MANIFSDAELKWELDSSEPMAIFSKQLVQEKMHNVMNPDFKIKEIDNKNETMKLVQRIWDQIK